MKEAEAVCFDNTKNMVVNDEAFSFTAEMRDLKKRTEALEEDHAIRQQISMNVRQRALSSWVRDHLGKDTQKYDEAENLGNAIPPDDEVRLGCGDSSAVEAGAVASHRI
ncbi:hypothetical protein N7457_000519 [Penicillium paradoxum]|uniref:uncharacterized protein n=1 Tax=Penicillium paradoxum TaxID=176176 RepID=UPI0025471EDE|nr:uncharacterized protein N7457_000519 [Penicillium paradoxum]KAJ5793920.1 hypothetical protein N7457_000519 [Penicillium paradoxum]